MAKTRHTNTSPTPPSKKKAKEKEPPQEVNNAVAPIQHICRTCLEEIQASSLIPLNDSSSNIRNELRACIPEVDCDLIPNAVICINCLNALHGAYQFKQKCLRTEDKIRQQVHKKYLIDLNKLKKSNNVIVPNEDGLGLDVVYISEPQQNMGWNCRSPPKKHIEAIVEPIVSELECAIGDVNTQVHCELSEKAAVDSCEASTSASLNDTELSDNDPDLDTHKKVAYFCKNCDYTCDILKPFILHLKEHSVRKYSCPKCDYQTGYVRVLARHLKTLCKDNNVQLQLKVSEANTDKLCASCGFIAQNQVAYETHLQSCCEQMDVDVPNDNNSELLDTLPVNQLDNNNELACDVSQTISNCLDEEIDQIMPFFIQRRQLIVDLSKSRIPESIIQNKFNNTSDRDTNFEVDNETNDQDTNFEVDNGINDDDDTEMSDEVINQPKDNDSEASDTLNFFCIHCNFSCVGMKSYRLHMSDHGGSRYICPCNFGTWRWQNFIMHVKRTCVLYKDLTPISMDLDKTSKRKNKRVKCMTQNSMLTSSEVSNDSIGDESISEEYIDNSLGNIHETVKPTNTEMLDCSVCDYSTCSVLEFENHNKNCQNLPRPYVCSDKKCYFASNTKHSLVVHMKFHSGDKPFRCAKCTYQTFYLKVLSRHLAGHRNNY